MSVVFQAQQDDLSLAATELVTRYEQGVDQLRSLVAGMNADQVRARPVPGRWSTLEVVCHLTDAEQFFADRMKRTIATDKPLLIGVDNPCYPGPLHYQEQDISEQLSLFQFTRQQMARTLRLIEPSAWLRTAVHSETGLITLRQMLLHPINHLNMHAGFLTEKRLALKID